jgi:hypothetical protein
VTGITGRIHLVSMVEEGFFYLQYFKPTTANWVAYCTIRPLAARICA